MNAPSLRIAEEGHYYFQAVTPPDFRVTRFVDFFRAS